MSDLAFRWTSVAPLEAWSTSRWEYLEDLTRDPALEAARLLPPPGHDDDALVLLGMAH